MTAAAEFGASAEDSHARLVGTLINAAVPDDVGSPDLELVERRVGRRRLVRTTMWAATAVLLGVAAVMGVLQLTSGRPAPPIVGQPDGEHEPGWTPLPDAPLDGRAGAASVWTGDEMIVLTSGPDTFEVNVAAYRPETDRGGSSTIRSVPGLQWRPSGPERR